ncbi:MAG: hypothetical protein QOH25_1211 [Acidobacteriota bacterium]|jgi:outer membrane biosynthesis protein TonB|nr:hypothetical protein [Acidobacteriota bacterium]
MKMAELFADFEINKTPRWRRLVRLTGISFILHALFFAAIIYVPVLREAFHIGSKFSDAEYVDEDYEKINIREAVMLNAGEKFQYPPGYFNDQFNNPAPEIIVQPTPFPTPQPTPQPTSTPTPSPIPSPSPQATASPATGDQTVAGTTTEEGADKDLDKVAEQNKVKRPKTINKRPFVDLLVKYNELKDKGELDLSGPVEMTIEADRNADGTLSNVLVTRKSGDPKLIEATKDFVAALSASGALDFLEGTDHLTLTLKLDAVAVSVSASTEATSAAEAQQKATGYNALLFLGAVARSGRDEATIMKNTKVTASGKQITISFNLPRSAIGDMLKKQIPAS